MSRDTGDTIAFEARIREAKERHNLSDIVGRHTDLKRRGARELAGLCPFHQERTPSFEVNDAKGVYHCHGCGRHGDAITVLRELEGMSFKDALQALLGDDFPVVSAEDRARRKAEDAAKMRERIELARAIWAQSSDPQGTPVEVYAHSRGITATLPASIRYGMHPRWRDTETGEVGKDHPAMVCAMQDHDGAIVGVQCIFLQDGGRKKYDRVRADGAKAKAKLTFGQLVGGALRLGPVADEIFLTEGPEDALTLMQTMPGRTVWASCGTANMSRLKLPSDITRITLAGDNAPSGRAAVDEATSAYMALGLNVRAYFPSDRYKDFNDQLRGIEC